MGKNICIGVLAHVDAGKTTLSEGLLYFTGSIKKMGRVDNKDAFLDTYELERQRGITIFSKQARFSLGELEITLLDTPGHVDFSAEMERALQVLDYAILVVSGADGVQSHTQTLWKLLSAYKIPVFIFVNKMDQQGTDRAKLMVDIHRRLDGDCVVFDEKGQEFYDNLAMCDEELMEEFLETGSIDETHIKEAIRSRRVFPCCFGSALKGQGIQELLDLCRKYFAVKDYPEEFGSKVYKITRDAQGNRLTHMKITGGSLSVKDVLSGVNPASKNGGSSGNNSSKGNEGEWQEKAEQIRIYSGNQFKTVSSAGSGMVCAVTGLNYTYAGEGLGIEEASDMPLLASVLTYKVELPEGCDAYNMLSKLRLLEEEEPQLHLVWDSNSKEIHAQLMGEIEIEILKSLISERFGVEVEFTSGSIVYRETIANAVEGVGHFEPLRHYAEVHLLLEPGERGSGLVFETACSEDVLDRNWQRLILTHLEEKAHIGVLTGSEITDMRITLVAGRAHLKHTEGGDFRQATYRALRQGLKKAESVLLEPVYEFRLEVPAEVLGRSIGDLQRMNGSFDPPEMDGEMAILTGSAPVRWMRGYQTEMLSYTKGRGRLFCTLRGYEACRDQVEIVEKIGYDSERDLMNPTSSVFCSRGTGFLVEWNEVEKYMHVESPLRWLNDESCGSGENGASVNNGMSGNSEASRINSSGKGYSDSGRLSSEVYDEDELNQIFERTYGKSKRDRYPVQPQRILYGKKESEEIYRGAEKIRRDIQEQKSREKYLLVDGYNIIFAWDELKELARVNIDSAREALIEILCNYQGYKGDTVILVFDAYLVAGGQGSVVKYDNLYVIYTKEAETADQYIQTAVHKMGKNRDITVATSDRLVQLIVWGEGAMRMSAQAFKQEVEAANVEIRRIFDEKNSKGKNYALEKPLKELK